DRDVAAAEAALTTWRVVTVTGVGGVGKTRVALTVAGRMKESFPDGACWVDLAPVRAEDDTIAAIAAALEIRPRLGVALVDQVAAALGDRRELLALDNCEQVVASVRSAVATLVERCPQLHVLATSRERIGVDGEWIVALAPLASDGRGSPAVELLADRIEAHGGDRTEMPVLVDVAQRVDGLPLALELVAGPCRTLGAAEVMARLDDEPWLLTDRTVPEERHQTLEAVLTWSYELLSDVERDLLQRLSVFASSFTLAAAERVAAEIVSGIDDVDYVDDRAAGVGGAARVDEAVASLVERSLLERRGDRFRLLETTRQFAARHLARSGHERAVQAKHTSYVVDRTRETHDGLHGPNEADWVTTLDNEWPDVRVVMRRAFADDDADTVIDLVVYLTFEAFWRRPEAFAWIRTAVDRYRDRPGPHRHELLGAGSFVAWTLLDVPSGVELAEAAVAARPATGPSLDAIPQAAAAGAYFFAGRADRALEIIEQVMDSSADHDDRWSIAQLACSYSSAVAIFDGDHAAPASARAVRLASALANPSLIAYALSIEAQVVMRHDVGAAAATLERARAAAELVRNRWLLMLVNMLGAELHTASGRLEEALVAYLGAADEAHRTGWTVHAWAPVWSAAACLHTLGRIDEAALFTGACQASGNVRFPMPAFPPELDTLISGEGDQRRLALYELGTHIDLPELVRIAAGQQPMPDVLATQP
ncbi:MAG TPA: NB-ARC domain-containing protein, partial [Ilumatobacteraceae bacterium]|nr:NB-ARC domain-containing protein [Ilumatobacteraceae bacterium]